MNGGQKGIKAKDDAVSDSRDGAGGQRGVKAGKTGAAARLTRRLPLQTALDHANAVAVRAVRPTGIEQAAMPHGPAGRRFFRLRAARGGDHLGNVKGAGMRRLSSGRGGRR